MQSWISTLFLFAQEAAEQGEAAQPEITLTESLTRMAPMMLVIVALYVFMIARPQSKQRAKQDALLKGLKKNDRVVTIGGIVGTIDTVPKEGSQEIEIRTGDRRITMLRSSIQKVVPAGGDVGETTT